MTPPDPSGGPAFPVRLDATFNEHSRLDGYDLAGGMTLRQYYKAAALQGIFARTLRPNRSDNPSIHHCEAGGVNYREAVKEACLAADALLAEDAQHAKTKP